MRAEIKSTTETKTIEVEIPVITERVHLDLSIQEAHFIEALLGGATNRLGLLFGVPDAYKTWDALSKVLGRPRDNGGTHLEIREVTW